MVHLVTRATLTLLARSLSDQIAGDNTRELAHIHAIKESFGLGIDLDAGELQSRLGRDVVVLALALLLLELEADSADGSLLDATHQVGGETGNLVTEALAGDDGNLGGQTLVGLEIEGEARVVLLDKDTTGLLDGLCADATLHGKIKY